MLKLNLTIQIHLKILAISGLVIFQGYSFAQEMSSGVFLTMKSSKDYKDYSIKISTRDNSELNSVFIPLEPIISVEEFTKVSEIINEEKHNQSYFYLSFSTGGIEKLKKITTNVEGVELVLVVNNTIIGYIKTMSSIVNKSILINGPIRSPDVVWAHRNLKTMIESRKKP